MAFLGKIAFAELKRTIRAALFYVCQSLHWLAEEGVAGSSYLFPIRSVVIPHII